MDLLKISDLDAILRMSKAWKEVESTTIQKSFAHAGFSSAIFKQIHDKLQLVQAGDDDEGDIPLSVLRQSMELFRLDYNDRGTVSTRLQ